MKYIWLIAFLFTFLFAGGSAAWGQTISLRSDYDYFKNEFVNSAKFSLPFLEARGALKNDQWNYGLAVSSEKILPLFPLTFMTGNLSQSGSISRLNSPALSTSVSAFGGVMVKASGLQASMPAVKSFTKPQSYFLQAGIVPKKIISCFDASAFYDGNTFTYSSFLKFSPIKNIDFSFCTTGGIFDYQKKKADSWFLTEDFYNAGSHLCFNNQICVNTKSFSSLLILGIYETPFGDFVNTWRSENLFKFKRFTFNLNGFYNGNDLVITSSDKKINPLLQVKSGFKYQFIGVAGRPLICATGFNLLANINLADTEHTLKSAFGVKLTGARVTSQISANVNAAVKNQENNLLIDFSGGSVQTTNSFYIKALKTTASGKITFTPDAKKTKWTFTEKVGLNLEYASPKGGISFANKNQITFTQKTEMSQTQITFSSSLSAKFKFRFCSLDLRLDCQE